MNSFSPMASGARREPPRRRPTLVERAAAAFDLRAAIAAPSGEAEAAPDERAATDGAAADGPHPGQRRGHGGLDGMPEPAPGTSSRHPGGDRDPVPSAHRGDPVENAGLPVDGRHGVDDPSLSYPVRGGHSDLGVRWDDGDPASTALDDMDDLPRGPGVAPAGDGTEARVGHAFGTVSVEALTAHGFIVPGGAPTMIAEEFRVVKRQLLAVMREETAADAAQPLRTMLVCSARPDEGKTFCAINLALSLAAEKDLRVVLIDGDVAKPDIAALLGITPGLGLLDAIADPMLDVEACLIHTDVPHLAILPPGGPSNEATELLASARTRAVLQRLRDADPRRILLFDSPPALAASPAGVLAGYCGQAVFVVRAETTSEGDVREALGLLSACPRPRLLLNGVEFGEQARRFGSYYGYGTEA